MQSEIESGDVLSPGTRAYFRERLRNRLYDLIIRELEVYKAKGFTQASLATRVGKGPDQISRFLSGPGNVTIDTVSDMLLGMSGAELGVTISHLHSNSSRNLRTPDWLTPDYDGINKKPKELRAVAVSAIIGQGVATSSYLIKQTIYAEAE